MVVEFIIYKGDVDSIKIILFFYVLYIEVLERLYFKLKVIIKFENY